MVRVGPLSTGGERERVPHTSGVSSQLSGVSSQLPACLPATINNCQINNNAHLLILILIFEKIAEVSPSSCRLEVADLQLRTKTSFKSS
jgi:hypothetical protein